MNTEMTLHLAKYMKYMDDQHNVLVVIGNAEEILISRELYETRYGIAPSDSEPLKKLLNACALAATSLSDRESWGWTLTLPGAAEGFFVGMEPEGMICARLKPAHVDTKKVYLQRQKNDGPMMQSHFEPATDCPVKTIEQYFRDVVQTQTRIVVQGHTGMLVQALPGCDFSELAQMNDDALLQLFTEKKSQNQLKPLLEFLVFYECRCDEKMIYEMVDKLGKQQKDELFDTQSSIEIECPRCGRQYIMSKNDLLH